MEAADQLILTVADDGLRQAAPPPTTTARATGATRAGRGWDVWSKLSQGVRLAGSFPIEQGDELLLVTDQGQLIRTAVATDRTPLARGGGRVRAAHQTEAERVVSVERLEASAEGAGDGGTDDLPDEGGSPDGAPEGDAAEG